MITGDELRKKEFHRHGQWSAEHMESLRVAAQAAAQREREMLLKLAECADFYAHAKRACFQAQERYREAIRTN